MIHAPACRLFPDASFAEDISHESFPKAARSIVRLLPAVIGGPAKWTMTKSISWLAAGLLFFAGVADADEIAAKLRVAVAVESPDAASGQLAQETVSAALARDGKFEVLERSSIDLLLREGSLNAFTQDKRQQVTLGRVLALDRFVHLRLHQNAWDIEIVDAQSGEMLSHGEAADAADLPNRASELLLARDGKAHRAIRLAAPEFEGAGEDPSLRATLSASAAGLRQALSEAGVDILDRALTPRVAREQADAASGFIDANPTLRPLLGAQVLLRGKLVPGEANERLEITLLDAANARVIGSRRFPLGQGALPGELVPWILGQLKIEVHEVSPLTQGVEMEALMAFYKGIALFERGQYLEATEKFQDAYTQNDKFGEAILWEGRCYDAVGLPELGDAMRQFERTELLGQGISRGGKFVPHQGLTFLGVDAPSAGNAQAVAARVSMLAVDFLAAQPEPRLILDEALSRFRDEYDQLVGTKSVEGPGWETAPGFMGDRALQGTLSGPNQNGNWEVNWSLFNPLGGEVIAHEKTNLSDQPSEWVARIVATLARLSEGNPNGKAAAEINAPRQTLPEVSEIVAQLKKAGSGSAANIPLLQLVLADPQNALLPGRTLSKPGNSETGIPGFLNHALRDHLIAALPRESVTRAWLELIQIQRFTDQYPFGRAVSTKDVEPSLALAEFAINHPDDLPGAVAQYLLLREKCGSVEPVKLAALLDELMDRLSRFKGASSDFPDIQSVVDMTSFLDGVAHIAAGDIAEPKVPTKGSPRFAQLSFGKDGRPKFEPTSYWYPGEWRHFDFTPEEWRIEARACLALAGRSSEHFKVPDRWLTDFPHSVLLACYCASAIHETGYPYGEPFLHPFDPAAEKAAYRAIVHYATDTFIYWMRHSVRAEQMDALEDSVRRVVMFTCEPQFAVAVSDAEQLEIRDQLIREMAEADARVDRKVWRILNPIYTRWRGFDRNFARNRNSFRLEGASICYYDKEMALAELGAAAKEAFQGQSESFRTWWTFLRSSRMEDTFGPMELAALAVQHAEDVHRLFSGPDFSEREMGQLLDFGVVLMEGSQFAEAERAFRKVVEASHSDLNRFGNCDAIRASAAYYLALLQRQANRDAEAAQSARLALDLAREKAFPLLDRYSADFAYGGSIYWLENTTSVRAHALRLLGDLRGNSARAPLPERVGVIEVPTPNIDNPRLRVYYHLPPGAATAKAPLPVLVLMCPFNQSPIEDLRPTSAWTQFADDAGLVLVAPEFFAHRWVTFASPAISGYGFPESWSGDALLAALSQLGKTVPVRQDGLLFHGFGEGAAFCTRFARWKPELCRAVSAHSTGLPWYEEMNGLHGLEKLRDVPFLVTCGEEDCRGAQLWNRYLGIQQFVTMARGAGIPLLWRSWPGVYHAQTQQMENLSRAFLRNCVDANQPHEEYWGDRRDWRYFPAKSAEASAIPELCRERLPSLEVARLWGKAGQ